MDSPRNIPQHHWTALTRTATRYARHLHQCHGDDGRLDRVGGCPVFGQPVHDEEVFPRCHAEQEWCRLRLQGFDEVLFAVLGQVGVQHGGVVLLEGLGHLVRGGAANQSEHRCLAGL